jgi:hypothetical protein
MDQIMEKKIIDLPRGGQLEVDCTPQFLQVVAEHTDKSVNDITDGDIRYFIHDAFKIAVDKAESDQKLNELLGNRG